ncbi:MAG: fumarate hydratase [Thermoleophilia bacterium]|nr:fumarate hydratase [Thermoleophilia bacterium]
MREIDVSEVTTLVSRLYQEANFALPVDVTAALEAALSREESPIGREVIETLLKNATIAARERVPLCQDTGIAAVFAEVGQEACLTGGSFAAAVDAGIARARDEGYLRASVVSGPCFERANTGDNTPAMLHTEIVEGDGISITVLPKGAGSENMSRLAMLKPADGIEGLVDFVVETVELAGGNPCPPIFLGVGVGGTMDRVALMSKMALLRSAGEPNSDPGLARLESEILDAVNALGIGPGGFGGTVTCLGVALEESPCHIASLPVAVNIQCNSARRAFGSI